jgi:uncharacterized damage-inducible protein DinB
MIPLASWTKRKFDFPSEIGVFPAVLMRLRGAIDRLEALIPQLSDDELITPIRNGWSIQEHIGHLSTLETLHVGCVEDFLMGKPTLRQTDMSHHQMENTLHNQKMIGELVRRFMYRRNELIAKLESLDVRTLSQTALHPRLGIPMRPVDLAFFIAEHDDHHFARIHECMQQRSRMH